MHNLSEQDFKNILAFMSRVPLKGEEALVFVQLQQKIAQQIQQPKSEPKAEPKKKGSE